MHMQTRGLQLSFMAFSQALMDDNVAFAASQVCVYNVAAAWVEVQWGLAAGRAGAYEVFDRSVLAWP